MLLEQEKRTLQEILGWDDANEAVSFLIKQYAEQSVHHARELLEIIPKVADAALEKIGQVACDYSQAAGWLMCQREMEPDDTGMFFASMLPVCKTMFPNGKPANGSKAEMEYWKLFVSQFRKQKVFSWDRDRSWADQYGYTEYLELVERQLREEEK